jgi:type III secretion system-like peptide-binding chaperone
MKFEHDAHRQAHEAVREYLAELFDDPYEDEADGHFYVRYGSTVLEVSVDPYGPEETAIMVSSYCVQGVAVDEELLRALLELNHQLPFGAFSLVGSDIYFSHALFGSALERRPLLGAIAAVATIADDYDDRIVEKYGGQTALELIRDSGGSRRRGAATSDEP